MRIDARAIVGHHDLHLLARAYSVHVHHRVVR